MPSKPDQQRRLFNLSQDTKPASRSSEPSSGKNQAQQSESANMGPNQLLGEHMDATGNPVLDPPTPTKQGKGNLTEEPDLFEAMNAETADFD
ncbi:uncharacterized protein N7482_007151 [Penicillium canariense]|uniref:Uncharacterized protein n=1 Tax=Penicillium canariense TaxID=189055 RepID=A0A9W9HW88_9EURO|nr:uncharacterized protein N7482_007151 [Penicillium canariense]KAJ5160147.1 hypothetical protein N7482_007151 [Penicillium canariense]